MEHALMDSEGQLDILCGRAPNAQRRVSASQHTCLICVLLGLIWPCRVAASSVWVYHELIWYRWHRPISCTCLLLAMLIGLFGGSWVLPGLFFSSPCNAYFVLHELKWHHYRGMHRVW